MIRFALGVLKMTMMKNKWERLKALLPPPLEATLLAATIEQQMGYIADNVAKIKTGKDVRRITPTLIRIRDTFGIHGKAEK